MNTKEQQQQSLGDKTVLLIEDDHDLATLLGNALKEAGLEVLHADDGALGLSLALKHHPDLILLDIVLPTMDGLVVLEKLREDTWGKDASVIILTNLSNEERVSAAIEGGVYEYLTKENWKMEDVVAKVKQRLGSGQ